LLEIKDIIRVLTVQPNLPVCRWNTEHWFTLSSLYLCKSGIIEPRDSQQI
jgi:hypothetical protein